tara:strand:- start:219 stop:386 length:168 start_codon:yes stop_codon:yes gene_type:complete
MEKYKVNLTEDNIIEIINSLEGQLKKDFEGFLEKIKEYKSKQQEEIYGKSCETCE